MPDDALSKRGRALEDEYFREKDRQLIEKMREANAIERTRRDMSAKTGIHDPEMLKELQTLGFTPEQFAKLGIQPGVPRSTVPISPSKPLQLRRRFRMPRIRAVPAKRRYI